MVMFQNGRFYVLCFLVACLISVTILAALHDIDSQAVTAIIAALIGGSIGHANGALQGAQQEYMRANGLNPTHKESEGQ